MKEISEKLELITKITTDDGREFIIDYKKYQEKLQQEAENYNQHYLDWYDFHNFEIDDKKLITWKPENWEHFKWYIVRNNLRYVTKNHHK